MAKKKRKTRKTKHHKKQANKIRLSAEVSPKKLENRSKRAPENPGAVNIPREPPITLVFRKTEFERSFRPFSPSLRQPLSTRVRQYVERNCKESGFNVDHGYWKKISSEILNAENAEDTLIVASRAGYGKSAFIKAFVLGVISLCLERPDYAEELSGIAVVLQKMEDLNAMVNCVRKHFDAPNAMVALQGWTPSAQQEGHCRNADVHDYQECRPRKCPYAFDCRIRAFHATAPGAYVVGLTQERFKRYLDTPQMEVILNRQDVSGKLRPRRYVFFDENPGLCRISALTKEKIDTDSTEFNALVRSGGLTDNNAKKATVPCATRYPGPDESSLRP